MRSRVVAPALAALLLAGSAALAQTGDDAAVPEGVPADEQEVDTARDADTGNGAPDSAARSDRSPTDYRASEEISEDLSVSFPVDI